MISFGELLAQKQPEKSEDREDRCSETDRIDCRRGDGGSLEQGHCAGPGRDSERKKDERSSEHTEDGVPPRSSKQVPGGIGAHGYQEGGSEQSVVRVHVFLFGRIERVFPDLLDVVGVGLNLTDLGSGGCPFGDRLP